MKKFFSVLIFISLVILNNAWAQRKIVSKEADEKKVEIINGIETTTVTLRPNASSRWTGEVWKAALGNCGINDGPIKGGPGSLGANSRGWALWNTSSIPNNAIIVSATIEAYCNQTSSSSSHRIYVKQLLSDPRIGDASTLYNNIGASSTIFASNWNAMTSVGYSTVSYNSSGISALQSAVASGYGYHGVGFMENGENDPSGIIDGWNWSGGSSPEPMLHVSYTLPPTLFPDLTVQNISVTPTQIQPGGSISVSCQVKNIGNGTAGTSRVGYYFAATCSASMVYLGDDGVVSLDPNETSNENETLTIPTNTAPGIYYVIFVADYQNSVPESNENNNKACGDAFFEVLSPTPEIQVNPTSLAFGNVNIGSCSSQQSYSLSGSNLTSEIVIHSPSGFEISGNGVTGWGNWLYYTPSNGSVSATIYVRFCPTLVQNYSGNITHSSSGASQKNVSVSGSGTEVPPNSPSNLNATAQSSTQINLSWTDNSNNESGFKIERKNGSSGNWSEIAQVATNTTSYSDNNLTPNTQYCYQVRAYNSAGNSNYSNESCATTSDVPPNDPTNLSATAQSSTQINLSWTDNSDNETGFKIEQKSGSSGNWSEIAQVAANTTSYSDNNLTPNTQYCYQVRAYNSAGNSNYSNESCATTSDVPPNPPTNLSVTPQSSTQINLSWTDNSNNESGFKIERKEGSGGAWSEIAQIGANTTTYNDNNLTPNTQYFYRVRAYNSIGNSDYTNEAWAIISSVKDLQMISGLPEKYMLSQNYPNPFNPTSTIVFGIAEESNVHLKVYDLLGNEVISLLSGETLPAGYYKYSLNAENLSSGIYIYSVTVLSSNGHAFKDTKKMILIK